jgi:hypothetical protein
MSSQLVLPIRGYATSGAGHRLVQRVVLRGRQGRAGRELGGAIVPEPVLAGLKTAYDRVSGRLGVSGGVLTGGVVATPDVAALSTAA